MHLGHHRFGDEGQIGHLAAQGLDFLLIQVLDDLLRYLLIHGEEENRRLPYAGHIVCFHHVPSLTHSLMIEPTRALSFMASISGLDGLSSRAGIACPWI